MSHSNVDALKQIRGSAYKRIKGKQHKIVDCFDGKYTFIRKFDEYKFNRKMNDLNITHLVLDKDYDLTRILEEDIENPIKQGSNMTFGLVGETGTGKTEVAIKIAIYSIMVNKKNMNRNTSGLYGFHLCWDRNDFEAVLKILKDGDIILKDEMPKHMGRGRLTQQWAIDNILNTVRLMENTFIFVDPYKIDMPCNIYLESAGMDRKKRINRVMLLDIDKNNKEHYYGHAYLRLHDNEELRIWYEREKRKFINRNLKLGGRHKVDNIMDAEFKEEKTDKNNFIDTFVQILENTIRDTKKHKKRNIFIWEHHMKDKEKYSFEELAGFSELSSSRIEGVFYNLNKKINDYPIIINLKLKTF